MWNRKLIKVVLLVVAPAGVLLFLTIRYWAEFAGRLGAWTFQVVDGQPVPSPAVPKIAWTIFALALAIALLQILTHWLSTERARLRGRTEMPALLRDLIRYSVLVFCVALALKAIWGEDVSPLIGALGVGGVVLGFALQETLSNFFAGLALIAEKPFVQGDWVQIGSTAEGRIEQMTWRATKIRTRREDLAIFPNSVVTKEIIVNFLKPTRVHALNLPVSASYNDAPDHVKQTLLELLAQVPGVLKSPAPVIYLTGYGDSAINYAIKCYIDDYDKRSAIEDQILSRVWYAFRRNAIEIPFPIQTVYQHNIAERVDLGESAPVLPLTLLGRTAIFAPLNPQELARLASACRLQEFGSNEPVIRQGEPGDSMFIIVSGLARVAVRRDDANSTETTVAELGGGGVFGEMSLLTGEPRSATVYATTQLRVLLVPKDALAPLLAASPNAAERLAEVVTQRRSQSVAATTTEATQVGAAAAVRDSSNVLKMIRRFFRI
ncbi:MAG: cyclic nucleotide-binding domain-containing protein [Planctomycetota bacterium]